MELWRQLIEHHPDKDFRPLRGSIQTRELAELLVSTAGLEEDFVRRDLAAEKVFCAENRRFRPRNKRANYKAIGCRERELRTPTHTPRYRLLNSERLKCDARQESGLAI